MAKCARRSADDRRWSPLTWRSRLGAVVTTARPCWDSATCPGRGPPVMEGKGALFREFAGSIGADRARHHQSMRSWQVVQQIAPSFGGINLEDISAPRCFEIEPALRDSLTSGVSTTTSTATAVVVLAALRNASGDHRTRARRPAGRDLRCGRRGVACAKIPAGGGIGDIAVADSRGIVQVDGQISRRSRPSSHR